MENKVIFTAALTGAITTRAQCPYLPYTPKEIAAEGRRAYEAGATVLHIHARYPDGSPSYEIGTYQEIKDELSLVCPKALINFSTGAVGISKEERIQHILPTQPDIAALNMGSMNYALYSKKKKKFYADYVFQNSFKDILYFLKQMDTAGTQPELEVFDTGHIQISKTIIDYGVIKPPFYYSLILGVLGGIPASPENLIHQISQLPKQALWQLICVSKKQWELSAVAMALQGNIRLGFEDNFYLPNGEMAKSNGSLVESGVKLAEMMGKHPSSMEETLLFYQKKTDVNTQ